MVVEVVLLIKLWGDREVVYAFPLACDRHAVFVQFYGVRLQPELFELLARDRDQLLDHARVWGLDVFQLQRKR